ncbi:MAG: DUF805 domain-containing protein [Wohlfahrtiimonas sp.]
MSEKYNLVFNGVILPGFDENAVKDKVSKVLKLPETQREAFFSGQEITLKKDLSLDEALRLKSQLEQLGLMITMMSSVMANMYLSLEKSQAEKSEAVKRAEEPNLAAEQRRQAARDEYEARMAQQAEDEAVEVDKPPAILSLSLEGRYGRLNYLNAGILVFLLVIGITFLVGLIVSGSSSAMGGSFIFTIIGWLYFLVSFRFSILRLHDLNLSGWYLLLGFVPFIGGLFSLYLLFAPGNEDRNDYGYPPREGSKLGLFGIVFVIIALYWLAGYR